MKHPFFSIAITTYNRSEILENCIKSCLLQTFLDFEIVIVDGASTDNTAEIIKKFSDNRINYFIQQDNYGISSCRHDTVLHSKGDWILQVDSDHLLLPDTLFILKNEIDKIVDKDIGAVCARYIWDNGNITPSFVPNNVIDYNDRMRWVEKEGGRDCLFCARRSALLENNWFSNHMASMDSLFHLNFSKRWKQTFINKELAIQYSTILNSSTRGHSNRAKSLKKWAPAMAWQFETIINNHGDELSKFAPKTLNGFFQQAILQNFYVGNRIKALRYCIYYFKRNNYDLKFYLITFIGIIKPSLLPKMNEWRHAIRNQYGF